MIDLRNRFGFSIHEKVTGSNGEDLSPAIKWDRLYGGWGLEGNLLEVSWDNSSTAVTEKYAHKDKAFDLYAKLRVIKSDGTPGTLGSGDGKDLRCAISCVSNTDAADVGSHSWDIRNAGGTSVKNTEVTSVLKSIFDDRYTSPSWEGYESNDLTILEEDTFRLGFSDSKIINFMPRAVSNFYANAFGNNQAGFQKIAALDLGIQDEDNTFAQRNQSHTYHIGAMIYDQNNPREHAVMSHFIDSFM